MGLDDLKRCAAEAALAEVESGMVVGLGHGSTALFALRGLGRLVGEGRLERIRVVPCSLAAAAEARRSGLPLVGEPWPAIDLTIDGADEVDPRLDLIKGGGGALLREKVVAQASRRVVIIVDGSKLSPALGSLGVPVPLEVLPFGWQSHLPWLKELGATVERRQRPDGAPFETDQGNYLLDCRFGPLADPASLAAALQGRAGLLGHGLFLGVAAEVIVGEPSGARHLVRGTG